MKHLFIINPLSGERMDNLFSTHPNTENRIAALQSLAAEFGQGGYDPRSTARASAGTAVRKGRSVPSAGSGVAITPILPGRPLAPQSRAAGATRVVRSNDLGTGPAPGAT